MFYLRSLLLSPLTLTSYRQNRRSIRHELQKTKAKGCRQKKEARTYNNACDVCEYRERVGCDEQQLNTVHCVPAHNGHGFDCRPVNITCNKNYRAYNCFPARGVPEGLLQSNLEQRTSIGELSPISLLFSGGFNS